MPKSNKINKIEGEHTYYFEDDSLVIHPKNRKYDSSIELARDLILDLDKKGNIIGIEILNASKIFKISKTFLKSIQDGILKINATKSKIIFNLSVKCLVRNDIKKKSTNLNIKGYFVDFIAPTKIDFAIA